MIMARKNRKKQRVDGFLIPVPFAGAVVAASALALTYVWLGCQCETLGQEIKQIEEQKTELARQRLNAEYRWARTKSPRSLEIALERHGIQMDWPQAGQVVRLSDQAVRDRQPLADAGMTLAQLRRSRLNE